MNITSASQTPTHRRVRPDLPRAIVPTDSPGISRVLPALPCSGTDCRAVLVFTGWMDDPDRMEAERYTCPDCAR